MKKPSLDEFSDVIRKSGGNLTQAATLLQVSRQTVHNWMNDDEDFKNIVKDSRLRVFDRCLDVAYVVAVGVPHYDAKTGEMIGWREKPDAGMLRYLLSTLGRDEGFGEKVNVNVENPLPTVINIIQEDRK